MSLCDAVRERLIDLLYGLLAHEDPELDRVLKVHLKDCTGCAEELRVHETMLAAIRRDESFPREREVDWNAFARQTVRRAVGPAETESLWERWHRALTAPFGASPAWAAAAAVLVVGATALATYTFLSPGVTEDPASIATAPILVREHDMDRLTVNLARKNTARYLKETRAVLVTLLDVNIDCDEDSVDVSVERAKAAELLRRQRLVATELYRLPLARAQEVCDDLQKLLLEISTLADCTRSEEIQTLRDVVEKRQILVRMELLSQELARRGGASV